MRPLDKPEPTAQRRFCLTELSLPALVGGAIGLSVILWFAVFAVLT